MKNFCIKFCSILLVFIPRSIGDDSVPKGDLISVAAIFRHGQRAPIETYPNDPYKDPSLWPVGRGQLMNEGKMMHYQLGKWFRKRYNSFLPKTYSESDIYVRSTDVDRTLMSAACNLAGLYPPIGNQMWQDFIPWQPIPIHTVPFYEDAVLSMFKPCEKYTQLENNREKSPEFVELYKKHVDLFEYLTKHSGKPIETISDLYSLSDVLQCESEYNFTLPAWTKRVFPEKTQPIVDLFFALACYNPLLARLKTGVFFHHLVKGFIDIAEEVPNTQKFKMFSGHDLTIANVLKALNAYEYVPPPYASSLMFELRSYKQEFFINLFYKNSTIAYPITLKDCEFQCPFARFIEIVEPISLTVEERDAECIFP